MNDVPCIVANSEWTEVENGILADVAPTILKLMELDIPREMTGKVLVRK
jgi:2,3-bisphosphoglycerate-independent phosphoglycerate mutase